MSIIRSALPSLRATFSPKLPLHKPSIRLISSNTAFPTLKKAPSFSRPGPPPLPPSDQAEFEALIKANETIGASPDIVDNPSKGIKAAEELQQHKDIRRGPRPDFTGDVNPKTGEMGGPKMDPFKAGDQDWSYAGRVTVSPVLFCQGR
ncbi:uncharacterized protein I303_105827 [Kwoniella dejecticola CBS 10117]|uniref:Succinate dehydrogenase assembly factor 4, mitochondrial n=1 Tax=Kwoniella dejecticola CBS 10117 TaxID=1296121 RepID=A0A1A6A0H5_9TREE|nr:uncharacterized protein I303_05849 [Kwoniella dejecticola CBS 10117]OBR83569.1 hypothetical protein I303_05849 [Kwoniella dejecticola CBS 10117]